MTRNQLFGGVAAVAVGVMMCATGAKADLIQAALQESGVNGGAIHIENTTTNGTMNWSIITYGKFHTQGTASDTLTLNLPRILFSNTIDTTTTSAGTLTVYVDASGQTAVHGLTKWSTTFETNDCDVHGCNTAPVTESVYLNLSDATLTSSSGVPAGSIPLQSETLSGLSSAGPLFNVANVTGPYSVIEVYTIAATAADQSFSDNINESAFAVPEPASLSLFGSALLGFGAWARRRKRKA